jgi:ubiquinone/menaquinone biosynthesis C-methylase UbiE
MTDVLDVGCGSGIWVLEMCHDYPSCNFTGIDILESQPSTIVPKNARFVMANVRNRTLHPPPITHVGLPFQDQSFDYIHIRGMSASIATDEWKTILPELLRILRPGGIIEVFDSSGDYIDPGHWQVTYWRPCTRKFRATMGLNPDPYSAFVPWLTEAGFVNAQQIDVLQPMGPWAGKLGMLGFDIYRRILTELKVRFINAGIIATQQEADEAFQKRMDEITTGQETVIWNAHLAQRPF